MKRLILTVAAIATFGGRPVAAENPIIDQGSADPSVKVFGGRAYLYGTHDFSPDNTTWVAKDWHVFSSGDLVTWVDEGVALDDDALAWRVFSDRDWAPDVTFFNDRYYFYFPLGDDQRGVADAIGVAAGDSPAGPFTDILGKALVDRAVAPARSIDPMAFQDVDGSRYLIWGNGAFYVAQLNDDMKSFSAPPQKLVISGAPSYEEGAFVWRHGGKYYLLYSRCGASCSDSLDYAIGDSVRGPYAYRGTIVTHGKRGNQHGSVFEFNGQWYVAYHDLAPTTYYRKTKLDFLHYTKGGDIPQVCPTDYGVGRYDGSKPIEAENYFDKSDGLAYEDCTDGGRGFSVNNITGDSWLKFQQVDFGAGVASFRARVAASSGAHQIEVHLGSATGTLLGTCQVPVGDQAWQTIVSTLDGEISGVNDVVLVFKGGGPDLFKLNWFQFAGAGGFSEPVTGDSQSGCKPNSKPQRKTGGCSCAVPAGSRSLNLIPLPVVVMTVIASRRRRQGHRAEPQKLKKAMP